MPEFLSGTTGGHSGGGAFLGLIGGAIATAVAVVFSGPFLVCLFTCLMVGGAGLFLQRRWGCWLSIAAWWCVLFLCSLVPVPFLGLIPLLMLALLHSSPFRGGVPGAGDWLVRAMSRYGRGLIPATSVALGSFFVSVMLYLGWRLWSSESEVPAFWALLISVFSWCSVLTYVFWRETARRENCHCSRKRMLKRGLVVALAMLIFLSIPLAVHKLFFPGATICVVLLILILFPEVTMRLWLLLAMCARTVNEVWREGGEVLKGNRGALVAVFFLSLYLFGESTKIWYIGALPGMCIACFWIAEAFFAVKNEKVVARHEAPENAGDGLCAVTLQ